MWKLKVLIQFFLALLPGGEKVNYFLQHIKSHSPEKRRKRIVKMIETMHFIGKYKKIEGSTVVEIGTGWDAICPLLFYIMGARICYTYDHVPHVRYKLVKQIIRLAEQQIEEIQRITSIPVSVLRDRLLKLKEATNLKQLFSKANIIYHAPGDASKSGLADESIDIVFSYGVQEHVVEEVVNAFTSESKRILRKDGIAYNLISMHDHYAKFGKKVSKVNFLKYSEKWWDFFVKNKISYHNRLREKQFLDIFKSHGANIKCLRNEFDRNEFDPSDLDVLKEMKIDKLFAGMTDEELAVYRSEIIMTFMEKGKGEI